VRQQLTSARAPRVHMKQRARTAGGSRRAGGRGAAVPGCSAALLCGGAARQVLGDELAESDELIMNRLRTVLQPPPARPP